METQTENRLKVLLAVHHFPPNRVGGAELIAARIARWLHERGHFVRVICIEEIQTNTRPALMWQDKVYENVPVRRLTLGLAESTVRLDFENHLLKNHFDALLDEFQPDVVHVISGYLMGVAPLHAAFAKQIPTVVTLTDFWFICPTLQLLRGDGSLCNGPEPLECARCIADERRPFRWLDEHAPRAAQLFWQTMNAHPALGAHLGLPERVRVLRARERVCMDALNRVTALAPLTNFVVEMHRQNGFRAQQPIHKLDFFDVNDFAPITAAARADNVIHFGYLGQIAPIKGVDVLLRAFLQLEQEYRGTKKLRLDVHGKFNAAPAYLKTLQQLAARSPHIVLHGGYEHARTLQILNEMDVVVVPSVWHENVPRVIFEAFAAKRPVIGSRIGGVTEVVTADWDGLLFERGDVKDLARVMRRVVEEPALLKRLGENARPPRAFDADMQELVALYTEIQTQTRKEISQ